MKCYMLRKNKKGSLTDLAMIMSFLFTLAVLTLIAFKVSNSINVNIQSNAQIATLDTGGNARNAMNQINNLYPSVVDNSFLLITIGLGIVALIFAMMVVIHPVFFVFYIIMLTIIIFIAGAFSNAYQTMMNDAALVDVASQMVITNYVMTYLPFIIGIFGFLLAIVMYKTWQNNKMF